MSVLIAVISILVPIEEPGSLIFHFYSEAMLRFQGYAVHGDFSRRM